MVLKMSFLYKIYDFIYIKENKKKVKTKKIK